MYDDIDFDLVVFDNHGDSLAEANINIGGYSDDPVAPISSDFAGERPIVLSPDSQLLLAAVREKPLPNRKITDALRNNIQDPEQHDPLSFLASPPLIQAAEIRGVNMIACLSDTSLYEPLDGVEERISVGQFLDRLAKCQQTVEQKDNWLTVRESRPNESRLVRTDRRVLGKYLRRESQFSPLTIGELAEFSLSLPDVEENALPWSMAAMAQAPHDAFYSLDVLRLYGSLTENQKREMSSTGLPAAELTSAQMAIFERSVFGVSSHLSMRMSEDSQSQPTPRQILWGSNGLLREPTECLPDGIPSQALLKMSATTPEYFILTPRRDNSDLSRNRTMSLDALASQQFRNDRSDLFPASAQSGPLFDLASIEYGKSITLTIEADLTSEFFMMDKLQGRTDQEIRKASFTNLPNDLRDQLDKAYRQEKERFADAKPGQFFGKGPPP